METILKEVRFDKWCLKCKDGKAPQHEFITMETMDP